MTRETGLLPDVAGIRGHGAGWGAGAGRLDLFLASWWIEAPSVLLRNETGGDRPARSLNVRVSGGPGVNRQGVGARVAVYTSGCAGDPAALLGVQEIAISCGYTSGPDAVAHFGLGREAACDVVVTLPHGRGELVRRNVAAGRTLDVRQ